MMVVATLGLALNGGIMLALDARPARTISTSAAPSCTCWATRWARWPSSWARWRSATPAGCRWIRCSRSLIALLIVWTAWDIIRESLNILLEGLPRGIQLVDVAQAMGGVEGVLDVHDLHIWSLGSSTHALSCHVLIEDVPPSASDASCAA